MTDIDRKTVPTVNTGGAGADKPEPVKEWACLAVSSGQILDLAMPGTYNMRMMKSAADSEPDRFRVVPGLFVPEEG